MIFFATSMVTASVLTAGICLLLYLINRRALKQMRARVDSLAFALEELGSQADRAEDSRQDQAFLKKRLSDRFESMQDRQADVSGKYRHVVQLERSGLGADEIAEILEVSPHEAEQMLLLARSSRGCESNAVSC